MSRPLHLLDNLRNQTVLIRLKGSRKMRGVLKNYDPHLNLTVEDCEELLEDGSSVKMGTILLRGDNVIMVSGLDSNQ